MTKEERRRRKKIEITGQKYNGLPYYVNEENNILYKNSSVDEIANVNVFTTTSYMYRPAPALIEPTSYLC